MSSEFRRTLTLIRRLGSGGFGEVHLGELRGADGFVRKVAVKTLHDRAAARADLLARHRDEARLLGRLVHDNIVQCLDLTEAGGKIAILLEYVEGVSATTILDEEGPLPPRAAVELAAAVADALAFAWSEATGDDGAPLRVVHRDIKPSNLLITPRGTVKVLDFGVARANMAREVVTSGVQLGTSAFLPPEAWLRGEVSHATDVFALGVTLAQLLIGPTVERFPLDPAVFSQTVASLVRDVERACDPRGAPLGRLLSEMLAYAADDRPDASTVHRRLTEYAASLSGEGLVALARARSAGWASRVSPDATTSHESPLIPISGSSYNRPTFQLDLGDDEDAPPPMGEPAPPSPDPDATKGRGTRWKAVAVGIAAAAALFAVVVATNRERCGDGVREGAEACDDGNTVSTDGCTATCTPNAAWLAGVRPGGGAWDLGSQEACTQRADCAVEVPATPVVLSPFWMQKNEMTVEAVRAWAARAGIVTAIGFDRSDPEEPRLPARYLNFEDALAVCRAMGGDLPTEAQWEYAARSGGLAQEYPWGDEPPTCDRVVLGDHACSLGRPWPVCSRPLGNSAQGICDLAGNVWEWTHWIAGTPPGAEGVRPYPGPRDAKPPYHENPKAAVHGGHVIRGGGHWHTSAFYHRARSRYVLGEGVREHNVGFRCVWEADRFATLPQ